MTLASLPSLDNNYLPIISGDSGYPTDNGDLLEMLTGTYVSGTEVYTFPHKTFDMVTVKEGQNFLNIPLSLTECRQYNYVCMKNSEMVYYYWIVDYECLNAEVTRIHLLEDTVQTWFNYVTNFRGQLARSHFRRRIYCTGLASLFDYENCFMINPDMFSVDDQASDINYLHSLCETEINSGYSLDDDWSYCLVILNPPLSNWFTFQSKNTKWRSATEDYPSYEIAAQQLDKEYATDSDMLKLITGFATWASSNLTGYEPLTVVEASIDPTSSADKELVILAFSSQNQASKYSVSPINTANYGGYDQYVYFAVKYNYLTNFFQSFPQLADYIVEIVQLPKNFNSLGKIFDSGETGWIPGFERIYCSRSSGTNSFSVVECRDGFNNTENATWYIPSDSFYLINDLSWLRGSIQLAGYKFVSQNLETLELYDNFTDSDVSFSERLTESYKLCLIAEGSLEGDGLPSPIYDSEISYGSLIGYSPDLRTKSIYNEPKLDLYPYKYRSYEFYGGIPLDVYYNALPFEHTEALYSLVYDLFFGVLISLDVSSVPTWSVAYRDDVNTMVGGEKVPYSGMRSSYWQSNDIPAVTYAYSYDSWSEYANYSKALTESNLKHKESAAGISIGSTIASGALNTAVSVATLGLGSPVSTAMSAKNMMSSATGVIGNVANTVNSLAQQRAKVANNASQLSRRTPTDKGTRSNNSSYYLKVNPIADLSNSPSGKAGTGPDYPGVVLTINYADRNQRETLFRNCDLYGYIAPYYVPSMDRGSSEFYAVYYSRLYRNFVQWEKVDLRFSSDGPKPTYEELEDLKARLINGVNFVHLPTKHQLSLSNIYFFDIFDEMMTGFPEYENLDTLAATVSGFQEGPYFYSHGSTVDLP